jgi:predicted O-methyltransferase YrrM
MGPKYGSNFLLAFDYELPPINKTIKKILFIHSSKDEQSQLSFKRVTQLYPDADFFILKKEGIEFPHYGVKNVKEVTYKQNKLPNEFHLSANGQFLKNANIDLVFFCANHDIRLDALDISISLTYDNILKFVSEIKLYDWTCIVDNEFCVYYPYQIENDRSSNEYELKGEMVELPHTMLTADEKKTLFELAANGPSSGEIVNIGIYLGGSSIILAKASKSKNREKVHSFDISIRDSSQEYYLKNDVADWVIPQELESVAAAKDWSYKNNQPIRLLFVDGDHSYEGCKNDILFWSKELVPDGVVAVHDYGNIQGGKFSEVVKAVYDTIISSGEFYDFKRTDTLFFAKKKPDNAKMET